MSAIHTIGSRKKVMPSQVIGMYAKGQKRTFANTKTASLFDGLESRFVQRGFA
jgi:hypothetical protein